jgi:NAD(P)-dependent dehydrogenase (short-subunit alcohol dehydrogenase family)
MQWRHLSAALPEKDRAMNIKGVTALVTGANRGIGAAVVDALIAGGAACVYAGTRTPTPSGRAGVVPIELDVTDEALVTAAARRCGDVHILVNNAGVLAGQPLLGTEDRGAAEREMRVNYFGMLAMCRAFAPILGRNGGGAIVNVLSILSRVSVPIIGSYAASKAASYSLTQGIRGELRAQRTLVIGILPGFVDTEMVANVPLPKLPPTAVAASIVEALRDEVEDVYPADAPDVARGLLTDPKGVERQFGAFHLPG